MLRNLAFAVGCAVILIILYTAASLAAADFGTPEEAKSMLERAVASVKEDKAKALDMFNTGEGGFKDRDLYVWCANASDGILTAHPYGYKGKQLKDIKGYHGAPFGETIMQNATEGEIKQPPTGGRALAQTSRSKRPPSTQRLVTRFVVSASTRNNLPICPLMALSRHLVPPLSMSALEGEADIDAYAEHVRSWG